MDDPILDDSETRYESPRGRFDVERWRCAGALVERPVFHHPGAVGVIVRPDPGHLLLVRQFRYPIRRWTLEIPAGTCDPGESPETTARRELEEEAGLLAGDLVERLRVLPAPGLSDEELILYEATGCQPGTCAPDLGELIAVESVPLERLVELRASGLICDAKTMLALGLIGCGEAVAGC